jgi:hypothetical protein
MRSLRLATLIGFARPESHFNLASAYERRGMLEPAKREWSCPYETGQRWQVE